MKRMISFMFALAVCTAGVSCGGKNEKPAEQEKNFTAEKLTGVAYKKEAVPIPDEIHQIYCFEPYNGGENYFVLGTGTKTPQFWRTDKNFENTEEITIDGFRCFTGYDIDVTDDGTIYQIINDADFGELGDPDYESPDYDYDRWMNNAEFTLKIFSFSPDGEKLSEIPVSGFHATDENTSVAGILTDGKTFIALIDSAYEVFSADGKYIGELKVPDGETIGTIGRDRNGSLVCGVKMKDGKMQIRRIDPDGTLQESSTTYEFSESLQDRIIPGTGEYDLFFRSMTTIYGVRSDTKEAEPLFSLNYSGLHSNDVMGYSLGDDGRFMVITNSYTDFSVSVKRYTECTPEEYASIPTLTIGSFTEDSMFSDYINYFNDTHDDMRAELKTYCKDNGDETRWDKGLDDFSKAMLAGDYPDIFLTGGNGLLVGEINIADMGLAYDMYEFLDNDTELSRDDFAPNMLESLETDGKLLFMSNAVSVRLSDIVKEKFVKDLDTWDFNSYMDIVESLPAGMTFSGYSGEDTKYVRMSVYDYAKWADFNNNTCDFDNPDFIRYLNYCNEPSLIDVDSDYYQERSEEDMRQGYIDQQRRFIDDKGLLTTEYVCSYSDWLRITEGQFGGEPIRIMGEPDGTSSPYELDYSMGNTLVICSHSDKKDLAWEFVKGTFSDQYYKDYKWKTGFGGFPLTKSGRKLKAEYEQQPQDNKWYFGEDDDYTGYAYPLGDDSAVKIGYVDDEVIKTVEGLLEKAVSRNKAGIYPGQDFYETAWEEFERFFHGECSAQECASAMQSRISILLSERE